MADMPIKIIKENKRLTTTDLKIYANKKRELLFSSNSLKLFLKLIKN